MLRQKILKKCREDIYAWLNHENGQIAIYDAVNPLAAGRRSLAKEFAKHDVQAGTPELTHCEKSFYSQSLLNINVVPKSLADQSTDIIPRILCYRSEDFNRERPKCQDFLS